MSTPRLEGIHSPLGADWFELRWQGETATRLSTRLLRGYCPCATCQGHGPDIEFRAGHDSQLLEIQPVGNYALRLVWGDRHSAGLYSFEFLYRLTQLHRIHGEALTEVYPRLP